MLIWNLIVTVCGVVTTCSNVHALGLNLRVCVYWVCWWTLCCCTVFLEVCLIVAHLAWLVFVLRRLAVVVDCVLAHISLWLVDTSLWLAHNSLWLSHASCCLVYISCCRTGITRESLLLNSFFYRTCQMWWIFGCMERCQLIWKLGIA